MGGIFDPIDKNTPCKTNMEPGKACLEMEKNIYKPSIFEFHMSFQGVTFFFTHLVVGFCSKDPCEIKIMGPVQHPTGSRTVPGS